MRLSILIPTFNRAEALRHCLHSVLSTEFQDMEVLVSDNCSEDDTRKLLASIVDRRLRWWSNDANLGFGRNLYGLVKAARGDYLVLMTDDSFFVIDAIAQILSALNRYPSVGAVVSKLAYHDVHSGKRIRYRAECSETRYFPPGDAGLVAVWIGIHIWPRLVIRREFIDLDLVANDVTSHYPTLSWIGTSILKGGVLYVDDVWVINLAGNKNYWRYPIDLEVNRRVNLINALLPRVEHASAREALCRTTVIDSLPALVGIRRLWPLLKILLRREFRRDAFVWRAAIKELSAGGRRWLLNWRQGD